MLHTSRGDQVTGPLTQRLMAAFLEENVMPPSNNSDPDDALVPPPMTTSAAATNNQPPHSADPFRAIKNGVSLERRVKQELIDQGLMSADDFAKDDDNDEILAEIVRVRTELSTIAEYNYKELQKLLDQSKNEMKRLEVKRQLDVVDQEVKELPTQCIQCIIYLFILRLWKCTNGWRRSRRNVAPSPNRSAAKCSASPRNKSGCPICWSHSTASRLK